MGSSSTITLELLRRSRLGWFESCRNAEAGCGVLIVMTRVAVVGATGYIGTRLVPRLADAGYEVRCLVRTPNKLRDRPWRQDPAIEVVPCDLTDPTRLSDQLTGCDAAFYLVHAMQAGADFAALD